MKGFLDIEAVSNLTGYSVDDIKHLVDNKQIPHNAWPNGKVIFPAADIEKWIKTHRPQRPIAPAPKVAPAWPDDAPAPPAKPKGGDSAGPPANPKEDERKAKAVAAAARRKAAKK